jgi:hypothetical protein
MCDVAGGGHGPGAARIIAFVQSVKQGRVTRLVQSVKSIWNIQRYHL